MIRIGEMMQCKVGKVLYSQIRGSQLVAGDKLQYEDKERQRSHEAMS